MARSSNPTTAPDELAAPLDLLLTSATRPFASRMMPNAAWARFGASLTKQPGAVASRAATLTRELGAIAVGGSHRSPARTDKRFTDLLHGKLYGGTVRAHGEDVARLFAQQLHAGSKLGYLHQLLAGSVWTSLFALPAVRQATLIIAGTDDPIVPVVNARIMHALLPHSRLHLHSGGHIDLVQNAGELAPVIDTFLREPGERP